MNWQRRIQTLRLIAVMIATVTVLMIAHLAEVLVWSLIYVAIDVAPEGADLIYFAFVNYTTLGYGDVTPVERWHLLGPMTAMNGVLLFGWSTAVIFEVLRMTLRAGERRKCREALVDRVELGRIGPRLWHTSSAVDTVIAGAVDPSAGLIRSLSNIYADQVKAGFPDTRVQLSTKRPAFLPASLLERSK